MRTIKITYDFYGIIKIYITNDPKDYERVVNIIHSNPNKYKVLNVEHIKDPQENEL